MYKSGFRSLTGDTVLLRPFADGDITNEYIAWLNDPVVVRYSNQRFVIHTYDTCAQYLSSFVGSDHLFLSVRRLSDDVAIGTMTAYVNAHHGVADLGIMIGNRTSWGQGLGQQAWNVLLNWFIQKNSVRKVTGGAMRCNTAMIRIMEKSGMYLEAVREKQELLDCAPQDILYYCKFAKEDN